MAVKNLKILLSGDSKPFVQSIEKSKGSMQGFKKESTAALDTLASKFGINTRAIRGNLSTFNSGLTALSGGFKGAAKSSGILSKAMKILQIALISTGIGAILVGLGIALAAIITYFKSSQDGADKLSVAWAKMSAVIEVLRDRFILLGRGLTMLFDKDTRAEGFDLLKKGISDIGEEMKKEAAQAGELEKRYHALQRREVEFIKTKSQLRDEISDLILLTRDENITAEKRLEYIKKAQVLQKELSDTEIGIQAERNDILRKQQALGENMLADDKEMAESEAKLNELRREGNDKMRELTNRYNEMTNKINANNTALVKNAQAQEAAFLKEGGVDNSKINNFNPLTGQVQGIEIMPPDVQPHIEAASAISNIYLDLAGTVNRSMHMLANNFGAAIGEMIAGEANADVLGQVIVGALADMAIQVGQIAIGAGLAKMAIDQALVTFGGGAGAVAAGIALVALGSAVKSSMARAASGGSGSIPSGGSGSDRGTYNGKRASQ